MDIILVRHGETAWNVGEVFRGRADIELNGNGRKQAGLLGEYLREAEIEAVYSSPLKRALDTARAIAGRHGLKVNVDDRLNDLDFGEWEGLTVPEVKARYADVYATWDSHPEIVSLPGGETLDDVRQRSLSLVDEAVSRHNGNAVLVTHRVVIKVLVCALLGLDNSHFWNILVDTCGMTTFRRERVRFVLIRHNDNSFLRPLKGAGLGDF
jgi:alpha-ribazole phosphatase/probable phosphoglycerate mutase